MRSKLLRVLTSVLVLLNLRPGYSGTVQVEVSAPSARIASPWGDGVRCGGIGGSIVGYATTHRLPGGCCGLPPLMPAGVHEP